MLNKVRMGFSDRVIKTFLNKGVVLQKVHLKKDVIHLRIQSDFFVSCNYRPGEYLRFYVGRNGDGFSLDLFRTYSIWSMDQQSGTINMAIITKSNGIGSRWIKYLEPGHQVFFSQPKGKFVLDQTKDNHVFIGDACTMGHFYELNRHVSKGKNVFSFIYDKDSSFFFPDLDGHKKFQTHTLKCWVTDEIIAFIQGLPLSKDNPPVFYIAGETDVCKKLYRHLKYERGLPPNQIKTKPFWHPYKKGLE